MSGLNRLDRATDLNDPAGREQLQETLDLMANTIRRLREELNAVREQDKRVAPVPVEEFPVAAGQIYTGAESLEVGMVVASASSAIEPGYLACDGASLSTSTYSDLFAKIGYAFGGSGGSFNVPDLRGRTIVGLGTGSGLSARTLAQIFGTETHTLSEAEMPSHGHTSNAHEHTIAHTHTVDHNHTMAHTHDYYGMQGGAGPGSAFRVAQSNLLVTATVGVTETTSQPSTSVTSNANPTTSQPSTSVSGAANPSTNNAGSGNSHNNVQPSAVLNYQIRYRLGPADVIQTLPISWGRVNAQWRLSTIKDFPSTAVDNLHTLIVSDGRPEAVVRVRGVGGTLSGNSDIRIIGALPVPYNFRRWKTQALRCRIGLNVTGVDGGASASVGLYLSDPISANTYLAKFAQRTFNESSNVLGGADFHELELTSSELGKDWRAGYLLRFELRWSIPKKFAVADLYVGLMRIMW